MISVAQAQARLCAGAAPLPVESIALSACLGRVLAAPIVARRDQPPFDASAMDGYAFAHSAEPQDLRLVGESAAGRPFSGVLQPGEAIRISTGAAIPDGADTVLIQENARRDGDVLRAAISPLGAHIRSRGGDFSASAALLPSGRRLGPNDLVLAASAGASHLSVRRRPRLTILGGGDEIVAPGQTPSPAQIFDSASFGIAAIAALWGAEATALPPIPDDPAAIIAAITEIQQSADILVLIGGASVGPHDHARPALASLGLELAVDKVAVRPGKPTWFGRLGDRLVLGLPGNPASAMVCARLFLAPLLETLLATAPPIAHQTLPVRLAAPLPANGPREHYRRAQLSISAEAVLTARSLENQDSSLVSVLADSQGLLVQAANASASPAGELARLLPWLPQAFA